MPGAASISAIARSSCARERTSGYTCSIDDTSWYWAATARLAAIRVSPVESEIRCRWK